MSRASMLFHRPFQPHDSHLRLKFKEKGFWINRLHAFIHRVDETEKEQKKRKKKKKMLIHSLLDRNPFSYRHSLNTLEYH